MNKKAKTILWIAGIASALVGVGFAIKFYYPKKKKDTANDGGKSVGKTWDTITDKNIARMHPSVREAAVKFINDAEKEGIKLRATSTLRTYDEQDKLYAQGRTDKTKPIVTKAKAGQSSHNFGTAMDVVPIVNGAADWNSTKWKDIAVIGKRNGFAWGGDWESITDMPHFEMNFGLSLTELRSRYESGKKNGAYVALA